ncbi:MAG: hypothetical protein WC428_08000 [Candidatus Paceibacterota bacterium]
MTKFSCKLGENRIFAPEAVLHKEDGEHYICQNVANGAQCRDTCGYKYSWVIRNLSENTSAYEIKKLRKMNHES